MPLSPVGRRLGSWSEAVERHPGRAIVLVGLVFAAAYSWAFVSGTSSGHVIRGDAIQYYAYLRSAVFDHDFDFTNEYEYFYDTPTSTGATNVWLTERTPAGRPPNMMSVGPALLWSPLYVTAAAAMWLLSLAGLVSPPDGFSTGLQLTAGLAGIAYATAGAWLAYLAARQLFPTRPALWATLVAWLAGPAIYYSVISPTYSHATSLFAVSLFVLVWMRSMGQYESRRPWLLGLLGGLAALVRWQDAIVLLLPASELVSLGLKGRLPATRLVKSGVIMALGFVVAVSPQLLAWHAVYGTAFIVPQGGSFMRWTEPAVLSVLFSPRHGLFLWTPALLMSTLGFWWLRRRDAVVGGAALLTLFAAIYVNAAVSDWWAGEAFGARRFISYTPLFALGAAAIADRLDEAGRRTAERVVGFGLVGYNVLFLLQYQLFMRGHVDLAPYPETLRQILFDRLLIPFRLIAAWLSA